VFLCGPGYSSCCLAVEAGPCTGFIPHSPCCTERRSVHLQTKHVQACSGVHPAGVRFVCAVTVTYANGRQNGVNSQRTDVTACAADDIRALDSIYLTPAGLQTSHVVIRPKGYSHVVIRPKGFSRAVIRPKGYSHVVMVRHQLLRGSDTQLHGYTYPPFTNLSWALLPTATAAVQQS
jgi:hypothetical protein